MAAYFQLFPKESDEAEMFATVDDKLCRHLGVEPHATKYYQGWYDTVGFMLALGKTWDEIREADVVGVEVIDFLETHYTVNCWRDR